MDVRRGTIRRAMSLHQNFFAWSEFDRSAALRVDAAWLAAERQGARARYLPVWRGHNLVVQADPPVALFLHRDAVDGLDGVEDSWFLGRVETASLFALDLSGIGDEAAAAALARRLAPDAAFLDLRQIGGLLPRADAAVLAYARGLAHWHQRHRFCGVCGHAANAAQGGHTRVCVNPACAATHFPRTDPATIMLVEAGDRCLLGRQSIWPAGMYSTLAGFVEIGESLEGAVAREVREESGIEVTDIRYHSSQPWPFPASLMLGFTARAVTTEIKLDDDELEDARWFSRADIARMPEMGLSLPRPVSIARRLIEDWMAG